MTATTEAGARRALPSAPPAGRAVRPQERGEEAFERLRAAWRKPRRFGFFTEVNNTHVGLLYVGTGLLFFLGAGVLALLMRIQLAWPGNDFLDADTYNQFFTMHGTVMMFLFAVPVMEAIAVLLLPGMLGARDMPFPRLSSLGYWSYAIGGVLVFSSLFFGVAPDGGWFMYPPLTGPQFSPGINADIWILGLGFVEIAAIAAAVELIVGILKTRAPGMTLGRMPIYAWYMLVTAGMIMIGMPAVIAADVLLELERAFDMPFYDPARGGSPLLWQHLFWIFGHPEVYIIFLPAAGIVSMLLPTFARTPLVGYAWVAVAAVAIAFLSFGLWVHHMYATGLPLMSLGFFAAASSAIAIPMGIQVFAWIATLWQGRPVLRVPLLFVLGFLFIFVVGGLTGVMVAAAPYDWQVHDTYFVVAHFHYVLFGGMVFPLFAALYYWTPVVTGRLLSERLGRWAFWLIFLGFNGAFLPMHWTGLIGMPRRVYTYPAGLGWDGLNLLSSAAAFLIGLGVLLVAIDLVRHRRRGAPAGDDPFEAPSLEWVGGSTAHGFRSIMPISSRYPLWEQPGMREAAHAGEGYLPDAPTGERETLVTSPITAEPEQILCVPKPTWLGVVAAAATAVAFAAATVKAVALLWVSALLALAAYLYWFWIMDRERPRAPADAGRGLALPLYVNGKQSVAWWGMNVFLIADAAVLASFAFSCVYLWAAHPDRWPPADAPLPDPVAPLALALALLAALALFELAERWNRRDRRVGAALLLLAAGAVAAGALVGGAAWLTALGLDPSAHSYDASIWLLAGFVGLHAAIGAFMALWCLLRLGLGMIDSWRSVTLRMCLLWWRYTAPMSALTLLLLAGFPRVVA